MPKVGPGSCLDPESIRELNSDLKSSLGAGFRAGIKLGSWIPTSRRAWDLGSRLQSILGARPGAEVEPGELDSEQGFPFGAGFGAGVYPGT